MIEIIENIDPINHTDDYDVILVGTNIYGRLANGWQLDMKLKYPNIHKANLETGYGNLNKIGKFITIDSETTPVICLLYICKGYNFRPDIEPVYVNYKALEECLYRINIEFKGKKIISPILGSSKFDGNGDKNTIIEIFNKTCKNVDITLYDYDQISFNDRKLNMIKQIMEAKKEAKITKDKSKYFTLVKEKKEFEARLKNINHLKI